jgi:hypothetical protein
MDRTEDVLMTHLLLVLLMMFQGRSGGGGLGITVYADPDFRGRSATFREDTPDLRPFGLTDRVSSLRVPRGEAWEVCEHINYEGRCQVFTYDDPDLREIRWSDIISSVRRVRDVETGRGRSGGDRGRGEGRGDNRPRLVLYDQPDYRGRSIEVDGVAGTLAGFSNRAGSLRVYGSGEWEVCEFPNFRGRCIFVSRDIPDLRRQGLSDELSSARPRVSRLLLARP